MHTAKTILLLRQLSPPQFRKLGKMVRSPFFTTNPNLVSLYQYLQPLYPAFEDSKLEKERVFQKVFPEYDYSDIKLRNLLRELTKLIEDLLIYYKLESEEYQRKKMLAEIYQEQKLGKLFERELSQLRAHIHEQPYQDEQFFEEGFSLNVLEMEYIQSAAPQKRGKLLSEATYLLDQYYDLRKIELEAELEVMSSFLSTSKANDQAGHPPILFTIYQKILALFKTWALDYFFEIKELLFANLINIRPFHQLNILLYLLNYAIRQMRSDDAYYNMLVLELYKAGIHHEILTYGGNMSDHTFLNICIAGAKAKDFEWTNTFIQKYEHLLSEKSRNEIRNLSLSTIYFHQGNFLSAIKLLHQTHFTNFLQAIAGRLHAIRCYYELHLQNDSYLELLIDQTYAFERMIRRNSKISPKRRQSYFNFTQFLRQLAKHRSLGKLDAATQSSLQQLLENQKITISKSWLIEKIKD